jgi:hypothetical protein
VEEIRALLESALRVIDHSVRANFRDDGLFHAYNLLHLDEQCAAVTALYPMLEGQVAVLSSGAIAPDQAVRLLDALFASDIYRPDQQSFMLYPDRELPGFLEKNRIPDNRVGTVGALRRMLAEGDQRVVARDAAGVCRFSADFRNAADLKRRLDESYPEMPVEERQAILDLYEAVFNHRAFTGRSGGMFGFEGLGCIYWHMVSKLLLAIQEQYFSALDTGADQATCRRLGDHYYRVRAGLGFNKSPLEYGAFPTDPYSHTPRHAGAQQPGMTGQVKEEVLTRFGELGLRVDKGRLVFDPRLLRAREFLSQPGRLRYLDVAGQWQDLAVPGRAVAFTWCQVPVVYRLVDRSVPALRITMADGRCLSEDALCVSEELSSTIFRRTGHVRMIEVELPAERLLA